MDDYLKDGKAPALILLLFLYGTASTAFVSCLQFLFKSHTIGLIVVSESDDCVEMTMMTVCLSGMIIHDHTTSLTNY